MTHSVQIPENILQGLAEAVESNRSDLNDKIQELLTWAQRVKEDDIERVDWDKLSEKTLVSPKQVSERLLLSQSKLAKLRCSGMGPKFVKLGSRTVAYRVEDIESYIRENLQRSTSES